MEHQRSATLGRQALGAPERLSLILNVLLAYGTEGKRHDNHR